MSEDFETSNSKVNGEPNTNSPRTIGGTASFESNGYAKRKTSQPRARRMSLSMFRNSQTNPAAIT